MWYKYRNLKNGLLSLLGTMLFLSVLLIMVFLAQSNALKLKIESSVSTNIKSYTTDIDNKIAKVASDVILLEELIKNNDVFSYVDGDLEYTSNEAQLNLTNDIYDWINVNTDYDQIRILDITGMEMIRVNYNEGNPTIVDPTQLQDKSSRYYFINSIDLDDEYIYLSKLDLNVENGAIEYVGNSPKAMLRIASTIYNDDGEQIGLLIVNYLANHLFHDEETKVGDFTAFEVINQDGYYLHSIDDDKEFGFMYPDRLDETFSKYHSYDIITDGSQNIIQQIFEGELYTTVVIGNAKMSSAISEVIRENIPISSDNGDIIIFGEVDIRNTEEFKNLVQSYIAFGIIAVIVSIVLTRLIDELTYTRKQEILSLEYASKHDVLTGLPNRAKVFEFISELSKNKIKYTLMFLDFDGFKKVNDTFGHDIGDKVLIDGSQRIKDTIRESDIISRIGGDEFIVVLPKLIEENAVSRISLKIQKVIEVPFVYETCTCTIGVSIGIATQDGSLTSDEIIKLADAKMYERKSKKKR